MWVRLPSFFVCDRCFHTCLNPACTACPTTRVAHAVGHALRDAFVIRAGCLCIRSCGFLFRCSPESGMHSMPYDVLSAMAHRWCLRCHRNSMVRFVCCLQNTPIRSDTHLAEHTDGNWNTANALDSAHIRVSPGSNGCNRNVARNPLRLPMYDPKTAAARCLGVAAVADLLKRSLPARRSAASVL